MTTISHYYKHTRVTKKNKENAAKAAANRARHGRHIEGYGAAPCQTHPSMPMIDGYGLLMIAVIQRACQDYVRSDFIESALALEWLLMDGAVYLEALDINVEIETWLIKASTIDFDFDKRMIWR